ncbi:MAG: RNA 2'-phosphotransferase [Bacteroidetes bacterium]|nr:RNA 2'-phosphotransferase [Bacteroidota bacterium]
MIDETKTSKFLSLVLRHNPGKIGIELDTNGWASVPDLLDKINGSGHNLTMAELVQIVETNKKKRFAFSDDYQKIRASQGHSVHVDLGYEKRNPTAVLYHGTVEKNLPAIFERGLLKRNRHHVHLSPDIITAQKVGMRHGKPIILKIDAKTMSTLGYDFFVSDNGVWLTDFVPPEFLEINE